MLTKRTNILFDQKQWNKLMKLASKKQISVGELIRQAIEEKFTQEQLLEKRTEAIESTLKNRSKPAKGRIDYKNLIENGHKY